jgi:phosphodiesterase/alkaline phosphatase D-like protein
MRLPFLLTVLALLSSAPIQAQSLSGLTEDNMAYGTALGDTGARVSTSVSSTSLFFGRANNTENSAPVFVFQLPTLPTGQAFATAELRFVVTVGNTPPHAGDLYGLGAREQPTVLTSDYYSGTFDATDATLLAAGLTTNTTAYSAGNVISFSGPSLARYLSDQYAGGAGAGRHVFLRLSPRGFQTSTRLEFASADHGTAASRPVIHYTVGQPPPPDEEPPSTPLIGSGPWVGGVTADSVVVTARLVAEGLSARLVASTSDTLASPLRSAAVVSSAASGNVVRLTLAGLAPGARYHYGIEIGGVLQDFPVRRGSFRTFPASASGASLRIGFGSCADTSFTGAAFDALRAIDPHLFIHTGDFHYRDTNQASVTPYRSNYVAVFEVAAQAAFYRNVPSAYMWDDHDFAGNDSNRTFIGRPYALQAYREWVPHYPLDPDPAATIHQAFDIGRVRVLMPDLRSDRDPPRDADTPAKTMLGAAQKQWLKDQLVAARDAEAPLILCVITVPWVSSDSTDDNWGAYTHERRELADFIKNNRIQNLVMLSGDMHALAYDDGTNSDYATGGGAPVKVFHAAALARGGSTKGGPYSGGAPIAGFPQYGLLDIAPTTGGALRVAFTGWRAPETTPRLSYAYDTEPVRPLAPTGLAVSAAPGGLRLTWTDRSGVETAQRVERSADGAGGWTEVARLAADVVEHLDPVSPGATWHYRIVAGNHGVESAPSSAAFGTTPSALQAWKLETFGDPDASDTADADGDGLPNLLEYALGGDPTDASSRPAPRAGEQAGRLALTFDRIADPDLLYAVWAGFDLGGSPPWELIWSSTGVENVPGPVTVADTRTLDAQPRRFLRLRVSVSP